MKFFAICFCIVSFCSNFALNPMINIGEFMKGIIKTQPISSYKSIQKCYPDELAILRKIFRSIEASPAIKNLTPQMYKDSNIIKNSSSLIKYLRENNYLSKTFGEVNKEFSFQESSEKEKWEMCVVKFEKIIEGFKNFLTSNEISTLKNLHQALKEEFLKSSDFSDKNSKLQSISETFINKALQMNPLKAPEFLKDYLWQFFMIPITSYSCEDVIKNIFILINQSNYESFIAGRIFGIKDKKLIDNVVKFLKNYAISNNSFERPQYIATCIDILKCVATPNNIKIPIQESNEAQEGFFALKELFNLQNIEAKTIKDFDMISKLTQVIAQTASIML